MQFSHITTYAAFACGIVLVSAAGPCDIFASGGTPCVAAHSLVRALYAGYDGPLYQVNRTLDGALLDVHTLGPGSFANAAAQDKFCNGTAPGPVPPLGTVVNMASVTQSGLSFRHCDAQGFVTPSDGNADHFFKLVPALNGLVGALSFQSVNYPTWYIAPIADAEHGRLGIVQTPTAADASWVVVPAGGGIGLSITLPGRGSMAVSQNLTGSCATNFRSPSANVYLSTEGSSWQLQPVSASCVISLIYDQSPSGNHLQVAPGGGEAPSPDQPVQASRYPVTVGGHKVYAAYFEGGMGYRRDTTSNVATGNEPETIYMVTSGQHYNSGCCFDYGNAEVNNHDNGAGTMEAVYFGSWSAYSDGWCGGQDDNGTAQAGPWVMADLENGLWACGTPGNVNPNASPAISPFVTAMLKGGTNGFGLKSGDATKGSLVKTYEGPRPPGYQPMQKEGAIILGIGGDNSNSAIGTFFEGCITKGYSTDATDDALQANIVDAGYGR